LITTTLFCLVIAVSDGDTIKARCDGIEQQLTIRLAGIDAPEKAQPFGRRSKQHLSDLCFGRRAEIITQTLDRYGRTVATVRCGDQDANLAMVSQGLAWVYRRYSREPSLISAEARAQELRLGLWSEPSPTPPWEWRKARKTTILHP
jgi:endonuclease YncB( thermonuclease family)